jgi:hypothetical protein
MATTTIIPDKLRAVVSRCVFPEGFFAEGQQLHFDHGHITEIAGKLSAKNKAIKKYPLIILVEDFDHENFAGMMHLDLRLFIVVENTKQTMETPERWQGPVKNKLFTIYEEFMKQLSANGFSWDKRNYPGTEPPHTMTVRTHFGVWMKGINGGVVKNIMSDPLDAIEISNLKINTKSKSC